MYLNAWPIIDRTVLGRIKRCGLVEDTVSLGVGFGFQTLPPTSLYHLLSLLFLFPPSLPPPSLSFTLFPSIPSPPPTPNSQAILSKPAYMLPCSPL